MEQYNIEEALFNPKSFAKVLMGSEKTLLTNLKTNVSSELAKLIKNSVKNGGDLELKNVTKDLMKVPNIRDNYRNIVTAMTKRKYGLTPAELSREKPQEFNKIMQQVDEMWKKEIEVALKDNSTQFKNSIKNSAGSVRSTHKAHKKLADTTKKELKTVKVDGRTLNERELEKIFKNTIIRVNPKPSFLSRIKYVYRSGRRIVRPRRGIFKVVVLGKTTLAILVTLGAVGFMKYLSAYSGVNTNEDLIYVDEEGREVDALTGEVLDPNSDPLESGEQGLPVGSVSSVNMDGIKEIGGKPLKNGGYLVVTDDYPKGLVYYPNGRVHNQETGEMGSWSYNVNEGLLFRSLNKRNLSEQVNMGDSEFAKIVDRAVDLLDGFVTKNDILELIRILTRLDGKNYDGKPAFLLFLDQYERDEGPNDSKSAETFINDVKSISDKFSSTETRLTKDKLVNLYNSLISKYRGGKKSTNPTIKSGNGKTNLLWDKDKPKVVSSPTAPREKSVGKTPTTPKKPKTTTSGPKKDKYHDCTNKSFPYEFGCTNNRIYELQGCIGVVADGKFGPVTLKQLIDLGEDMRDKKITHELWRKITDNCSKYKYGEDKESRTSEFSREKRGFVPMIEANHFYTELVGRDLIKVIRNKENTGTYVVYVGDDMNDADLFKLDTALQGMGYSRTLQLNDVDSSGTYFYKKN